MTKERADELALWAVEACIRAGNPWGFTEADWANDPWSPQELRDAAVRHWRRLVVN